MSMVPRGRGGIGGGVDGLYFLILAAFAATPANSAQLCLFENILSQLPAV